MSHKVGRIGYVLFLLGWMVVLTKDTPWVQDFFKPSPLETIGATLAHHQNLTGKGAIVAVIDEGFDLNHEGLRAQTLPYRYNTDDKLPYADISVYYHRGKKRYEFESHGTHVSGIILGGGNLKGVAPDAKLIPIKMGIQSGEKSLIKALNLARQSAAQIVNISMQLSFSGRWINAEVRKAIVDLAQSGKIIVIAAGNSHLPMMSQGYLSDLMQVAHSPEVQGRMIVVGSIGDKNTPEQLSSFSNYPGNFRATYFITAPGYEITSLAPDNEKENLSGTSMAAPFVSGALALLKEKFPKKPPEELVQILLEKARKTHLDSNLPLNPVYYGAGILDLRTILQD